MKNIIEGTDENFSDEVLRTELPVLVDFWAPWCAPCRMIAPIVEQIADEMKDQVKVVKVNVDENRDTAALYRIISIPTLGIFKNGRMVDALIGAVPKEKIIKKIEPYFSLVN